MGTAPPHGANGNCTHQKDLQRTEFPPSAVCELVTFVFVVCHSQSSDKLHRKARRGFFCPLRFTELQCELERPRRWINRSVGGSVRAHRSWSNKGKGSKKKGNNVRSGHPTPRDRIGSTTRPGPNCASEVTQPHTVILTCSVAHFDTWERLVREGRCELVALNQMVPVSETSFGLALQKCVGRWALLDGGFHPARNLPSV